MRGVGLVILSMLVSAAPAALTSPAPAALHDIVAPPSADWLVERLDAAPNDWIQDSSGPRIIVFVAALGMDPDSYGVLDIAWFHNGTEVQRCGPFFSYGGTGGVPELWCQFWSSTIAGTNSFLVLATATHPTPSLEAHVGFDSNAPLGAVEPPSASGNGAHVSWYGDVRWQSGQQHFDTQNVNYRDSRPIDIGVAHAERTLEVSIHHPVAVPSWSGISASVLSLDGAGLIRDKTAFDSQQAERSSVNLGATGSAVWNAFHASAVVNSGADYSVCSEHATEAHWFAMVVAVTVPFDPVSFALTSPTRVMMDAGRGIDTGPSPLAGVPCGERSSANADTLATNIQDHRIV